MKSICVFCGSSRGRNPRYLEAVAELGRTLARSGIQVVYGGAQVGTMGALADAALEACGQVVGVITQLVDVEIAHRGLTDLQVVGSMHQRKARMADLADGFVALPGGVGTLEEFAEVLTWSQLGIHAKPTGLLNVDGYYDPLLAFFDQGVDQGFIRPEHRDLVLAESSVDALLDAMRAWEPSAVPKWVDPPPPR